jgi:hypothetical protein
MLVWSSSAHPAFLVVDALYTGDHSNNPPIAVYTAGIDGPVCPTIVANRVATGETLLFSDPV